MEWKNKIVAVLSEKIEPGRAMNALAHMAFGMGATLGKDDAFLTTYVDAQDGFHSTISGMPIIVLKAKSSQIRKLRQEALEKKIKFNDFIDTMIAETYKEQLDRTKKKEEKDLEYWGIFLFGDFEQVKELTRKFSLWK
ncbi:hypothetical protein COV18_02620 [Candidatus Woesearchaeota archaeon CG10_big_fil_rev_8_21_14_0_10_37_12]|nr:MAG: hypothetical protein COV18_02620 [Candidatus Woesearchaeota archaeon CG10_big_fil_rev_8_21_14_0_10_37_12]